MISYLSSSSVEQLAALLGSLARLIASGSRLTEYDLQILLMGTDLEPESAIVEELCYWAILLRTIQEDRSERRCSSVTEELTQRGLSNESAVQAVCTVVEANLAPSTMLAASSPEHKLKVHPNEIDFGTLIEGQVAVVEIEIQGGPGCVVADSKQFDVSPTYFDAGVTRIRVKARQGADPLLWTPIKLVTLEEMVIVPVLALWSEPKALLGLQALPPEVVKLLSEGSSFMPDLNQHVLTRILRDLNSGECRYAGEAIARQLLSLPVLHGLRMLMKVIEGDDRFSFEDVEQYRCGFDQYADGFMNSISLLYFAYGALPEKLGGAGLEAARQFLAELSVDPTGSGRRRRDYVEANLEYAVGQLRLDISGRRLLKELLEGERLKNIDAFYTVGTGAAYRVFAVYWQEIDKRKAQERDWSK